MALRVGEVIKAIAAAAIELAGAHRGRAAWRHHRTGRRRQSRRRSAKGYRCRRRRHDAARVARVPRLRRFFPRRRRCRKHSIPTAPLCVAIDPLDGSANLENNISVGTIFSIRPRGNDILSTFFEPGTAQCAAGFVVYGPQTTLVLALNDARRYLHSRSARAGIRADPAGVRIAPDTPEFAINASNRRHWHGPVRAYIDECLAGTNGDRERGFQHALDRFAGGGVASHPGARRRVPLSGRCPPRLSRGQASSAVRGPSDGAGDGMGGRRGVDRAPANSRTWPPRRRTSGCR